MAKFKMDIKVVEMHQVEIEAETFEEALELAEEYGPESDNAWKTDVSVLGGYEKLDILSYENA